MGLLGHNGFEFSHVLRGGYKIQENTPDVLSKQTMANGAEKRNYGQMPKTTIKVKFSQLDKSTYQEYMSHFSQNEDVYSYFSPRQQTEKQAKFFVTFPENSLLYIDNDEQDYDEFTVVLTQIDEVGASI